MLANMKVTYDSEVDVLRLLLSDARIQESDEDKPGVILDYDDAGNVVGLETLNASQRVDNPPRDGLRGDSVECFWERGQGTASELDLGGCRRRPLNSLARARSGCGALDRVLGKGSWCIQNLKPFPDPVSVRIHRPAQLVGDAPEGAA